MRIGAYMKALAERGTPPRSPDYGDCDSEPEMRAVQLGGVFVPADSRGRGIAKTGVRAICAQLLERHELVTLYCDENNAPALRVYEHVGFRFEFFNRSYLLEQPSARSEQLGYG